jgi:hypothetical protein
MKSKNIKNQRIRLICNFLDKGGGSLNEMMVFVNRALYNMGLDEIGLRMLQYCIEDLRKGDFDHMQNNLPKKQKQGLFKINFSHKKYSWAEGSQKPVFGDLEKDERFSLPFLTGLLKKYESIPAVNKILSQLPEIFNISETEMQSSEVIFHAGPTMHNDDNHNLEANVISCVIELLKHMYEQNVIEFNYHTVKNTKNDLTEKNLKTVMPLAIKYYEHYYYLFAVDYNLNLFTNFRIDQIVNYRVDPYLDKDDNMVNFDRVALSDEHNLQQKLQFSLGVWTFKDKPNLYEFHIEFYGWAANYIKNLKFHETQKKIGEGKDSIIFAFRLNVKNPPENINCNLEDVNTELAFLLGRFRNFCKIIEINKY